ncbi:MAG: hypothetical protein Q9222_001686 [Ikaeria aurantiellina]
MGNCTSTPLTKDEKAGYYGPPAHKVRSAETQLDALLKGTGTRRVSPRAAVPGDVKTGNKEHRMSGGVGKGDNGSR